MLVYFKCGTRHKFAKHSACLKQKARNFKSTIDFSFISFFFKVKIQLEVSSITF